MLKKTLVLVGLTLSLSANAVVQNTINGIDYDWFELSETQGLSRDQVEARLADVNDVLYGFEYASRQLVEDLFSSYASYDGLDGWHGDASTVSGIKALISDFGPTHTTYNPGTSVTSTVDGFVVTATNASSLLFTFYGLDSECGGESTSCVAYAIQRDTMVDMRASYGYDALSTVPATVGNDEEPPIYASFIVAPSAVPIPAAGWLFMSALIGLAGKKRLARR